VLSDSSTLSALVKDRFEGSCSRPSQSFSFHQFGGYLESFLKAPFKDKIFTPLGNYCPLYLRASTGVIDDTGFGKSQKEGFLSASLCCWPFFYTRTIADFFLAFPLHIDPLLIFLWEIKKPSESTGSRAARSNISISQRDRIVNYDSGCIVIAFDFRGGIFDIFSSPGIFFRTMLQDLHMRRFIITCPCLFAIIISLGSFGCRYPKSGSA